MTPAETSERLVPYTSGDGAIYFYCQKDGVRTFRTPSLSDLEEYLAEDGKPFAEANYKAVCPDKVAFLVGDVQRIDESTLKLGDYIFHYRIEPNALWEQQSHCVDHFLKLTYEINGEIRDVINHTIRSQIRYFLNYETPASEA